ncbi:hypothetical protein PENTCL1PPCAC_27253, partial [Pristionchus entomophagus]
MGNLTLDVFWISFMPVYQHTIGAVTAVLSVLVIYLMITRTPENGRALARYLILMQLSILIVDLGWGFLVCPVFFFPLTALLCNGVLCGSETSKHAGVVVLFQCTVQVAIALSFTLHYKYTAIARLTNHRQITVTENMIVRLIFFFALEMPVAVIVVSGASQQEIQMFMRSEHQLALLSLLEDDVALIGIAYSIRRFLWIPITLAAVVLVAITISVGGCIFFVAQTLRMLSIETTAISERTRKLQRGLTYTLVMQLGMPLAIQVLPIFIYVFSMTLFLFTPGAMNFLLCIQLCHASFHTIFLILTTPSYRRAI